MLDKSWLRKMSVGLLAMAVAIGGDLTYCYAGHKTVTKTYNAGCNVAANSGCNVAAKGCYSTKAAVGCYSVKAVGCNAAKGCYSAKTVTKVKTAGCHKASGCAAKATSCVGSSCAGTVKEKHKVKTRKFPGC